MTKLDLSDIIDEIAKNPKTSSSMSSYAPLFTLSQCLWNSLKKTCFFSYFSSCHNNFLLKIWLLKFFFSKSIYCFLNLPSAATKALLPYIYSWPSKKNKKIDTPASFLPLLKPHSLGLCPNCKKKILRRRRLLLQHILLQSKLRFLDHTTTSLQRRISVQGEDFYHI